jgi:hypothetical protein
VRYWTLYGVPLRSDQTYLEVTHGRLRENPGAGHPRLTIIESIKLTHDRELDRVKPTSESAEMKNSRRPSDQV